MRRQWRRPPRPQGGVAPRPFVLFGPLLWKTKHGHTMIAERVLWGRTSSRTFRAHRSICRAVNQGTRPAMRIHQKAALCAIRRRESVVGGSRRLGSRQAYRRNRRRGYRSTPPAAAALTWRSRRARAVVRSPPQQQEPTSRQRVYRFGSSLLGMCRLTALRALANGPSDRVP